MKQLDKLQINIEAINKRADEMVKSIHVVTPLFADKTTKIKDSCKMSKNSIFEVYGDCKDGSLEVALLMNGYEV